MSSPVNPNKALWEKGDFTRIAATMRESGESLIQRIGVHKGIKVLDLGCGDGTTALPAAVLGAEVLGVDIARNLVEAGNKRAAEAGLHLALAELPAEFFGNPWGSGTMVTALRSVLMKPEHRAALPAIAKLLAESAGRGE